MSFSAKILKKTVNHHLRWRHVNTCCRVTCAYYAYVTIRPTLGGTCFESRHFVNKVSGQHFSAENKQEAAECYSQHLLPVHSRDVIWKIKLKSNFPVSFNLIIAKMNLVGNYWTLRGLRTVNPEGLPSTRSWEAIRSSIIKWPKPLGACPRSIKNANKILQRNVCKLYSRWHSCWGFKVSKWNVH